jgi:hypothetical protein
MRTDDALARAPEVSISDLSARLKISRDPEIHPTAHDRLVQMIAEVGIDPEASCLAETPADIQWMVRAGYGVAIVDQRTILDQRLTTRPIAVLLASHFVLQTLRQALLETCYLL